MNKQEENANTITLENNVLRIRLSRSTNGGLSHFEDIATKRNFIFSKPYPLYRLVLSKPGAKPMELSSVDAESFKEQRSTSVEGERLVLVCDRHRGLDIGVTCTVLLKADSPMTYWRISVKNNTEYGIRAMEYPVVVAPLALGDSDEDDYFLGQGYLIHKPGRGAGKKQTPKEDASLGEQSARYQWFPHSYPGVTEVQLQAYYDDAAGLYMATYDDKGCTKHFRYPVLAEEGGMDLSITHHYDEKPGLNFDLPYETVLGVFHGDWYAAADIYKEWAHRQHWCKKKLVERTDIPDWAKEPRPNLMIICRGNVERARGSLNAPPAEWPIGKYWPAKKIVPIIRKYSSYFETPAVVWYEGFEKIGSPGGPVDVFPPYEGEESFKAAMEELKRDGHCPLLYITGFHWCYKRAMTGYDGRERFEKEGKKSAVVDENGRIPKLVFANAQKEFVNLCVADKSIRKLLMENLLRLIELGGVAVQIDQQLGMYAQVCYSDRHGHTPGYGPWMYENVMAFLKDIRAAIKKQSPEITFSYEGACETWMQQTDLHLNRAYRKGIPLFDYLYHEYALSFGGDAQTQYCHPDVSLIKHAQIFSQGAQNVVCIGEPEYDIDMEEIERPVLPLLKNIFYAQRHFACSYLVFGQMLKPTKLKVAEIPVDRYLPLNADVNWMGTIPVPLVFHSVWRSPEGKTGYVLVNWTGSPEKVTLSLVHAGGKGTLFTGRDKKSLSEKEMKSGEITTTVPARNVILIEQENEK